MLLGKILSLKKSPQQILADEERRMKQLQSQLELINDYKMSKHISFDSVIPLKIFQTWHTKRLPPMMRAAVQRLRERHPRFEYYLFDDNDCRLFIKEHFAGDVLNSFDRLIPGAYKADLWRYCVLYINGGIYLDIKYGCINTFRFIELTEKEHLVFDIDNKNIYNALIVVKPKNEILFNCINRIVENVKNRYYGTSGVDPTGPGLVAQFMTDDDRKNIELRHAWNSKENKKYIIYKKVPVLKMYEGYYGEQEKYKKVDHYNVLWNKRQIYR
jgi:mannosyltransferase OCH1-like enzyme